MTSSISTSPQQSVEEPQKKAGDIELCLAGRKTYLVPLPLPTAAEPCCPYISDYNDTYLDFGGESRMYFRIKSIWAGRLLFFV